MAEYQSGGGELFELFKNFDAQGITSTVDNISDFFSHIENYSFVLISINT